MAEKNRKGSQNVRGLYYVDEDCIACSLCSEIAPDNFATDQDTGYDYVFYQPVNSFQFLVCEEARESCPVEAIGNDG